MSTVTLPLMEAITGFGAVKPHAAPAKEVTEIIKHVHVEQVDEDLALTATDRYTVGSYRIPVDSERPPEMDAPFMVPVDLVAWIAGLKTTTLQHRYSLSGYWLRIDTDDATVAVSVIYEDLTPELTRSARKVGGNYPPVAQLIDNFKPGEQDRITLGTRHLAKFVATAKVIFPKGESAMLFEHSEPYTPPNSERSKPGPIRVRIGDHFTGLMQPNLLLR